MTIKIDKNIPIPPERSKARTHGWTPKYPWRQMEVGDSFLLAGKPDGYARTLAYSTAQRTGHRYKVRKVPEGFRIWRIA